jgi:hypothetical protein
MFKEFTLVSMQPKTIISDSLELGADLRSFGFFSDITIPIFLLKLNF